MEKMIEFDRLKIKIKQSGDQSRYTLEGELRGEL